VHYKRVPIRIAVYFSKLHFITHSITFGVSHSEMPSHLLIETHCHLNKGVQSIDILFYFILFLQIINKIANKIIVLIKIY
jgi:hypothetical protein